MQKVDRNMMRTCYFLIFHDIPVLEKYGSWCSISHPLHVYAVYDHLPKTNTSLVSNPINSSAVLVPPVSCFILPRTNLFESS